LAHPFKKEMDVACPITLFPWHGTRWRDKRNLFISLDGERKTTDPFWQHARWETNWMQGEKSSFEGILTNGDDTLADLDSLRNSYDLGSCLRCGMR
jgi:hypothetical protein